MNIVKLQMLENGNVTGISQDINVGYLLDMMLGVREKPWMEHIEIITDYMPPFPREDTRPTVQIRYNDGSEYPPFLRYGSGPIQTYFWDMYGGHFHSVELALVALSRAPAPRYVGPITFTIPLPKTT